MKKSTFLHLRFPFSFFLLPVFLLACAISEASNPLYLFLSFFILHFLIYPASNGYNSYFDKDEQSIGGLKHPPKVTKELYWISLLMDALAMLLGLIISWEFTVMIFIYGLVSKAYSHPTIRLKKYPLIGWLAAGIFQGYFTYLLSFHAISGAGLDSLWDLKIQIPGILSTLLLLGSYPMTQIYQHEEDQQRGDLTLSRWLGLNGTFYFTSVAFTLATIGFVSYFLAYFGVLQAYLFPVFLSPVLIYFGWWFLKFRTNPEVVDFDHTMKLNFISSLMLNIYFGYLCL